LDTRVGFGAAGPLAAEATLAFTVPGVPADATAVVVNVTVTEPDRDGFLTVFPCGRPRPLASNLNFATGENRPNLVIAVRGVGGQICFSGNATTHLLADLAGWYAPADATVSWTDGEFVHFALYESKDGSSTSGAQIAFRVNDLDGAHRPAVDAGAEVVHGPKPQPWGRSARYRDNDGNIIELTQHA
jgi:catechol 2,3-dioxygenase-like lactoylglutathione lyase family enzyme